MIELTFSLLSERISKAAQPNDWTNTASGLQVEPEEKEEAKELQKIQINLDKLER